MGLIAGIIALVALVAGFNRCGTPYAPKPGTMGPLLGMVGITVGFLGLRFVFGSVVGWVYLAVGLSSVFNLPITVVCAVEQLTSWARPEPAPRFKQAATMQ